MARQEFSPNVLVSDNYDIIGNESVYGCMVVSSVPVALKVGEDELQERTSLFIQSDIMNSDEIYLGLDNQVSKEKYFGVVYPGHTFSLTLSNNTEIAIYGYCESESKIGLIEIKS